MAKTNHNITHTVPFFMVRNMRASLSFYVDGLGFTIANTWQPEAEIEWCLLQRHGGMLMLQQYRPEFLQNAAGPRGEGVSVYFICEDALALYTEFREKGLLPEEPFVGNAMWVVSIHDPDGYSLHFESATDVAEETRYIA